MRIELERFVKNQELTVGAEEIPVALIRLRAPTSKEASWRLADWNAAAESLLLPGIELAKGTLSDVLPGLDTPELRAHYNDVQKGGQSRTVDFCDHSQTHRPWLALQVTPTKGGLLVALTDVTASHHVRLKHLHEARLLHEMYEEAPFAACVVGGAPAMFEFTNDAFEQLVQRRHLVGTKLSRLTDDGPGRDIKSIIERVKQTSKRLTLAEHHLPGAFGRTTGTYQKHFRIVAQPLEHTTDGLHSVQLVAFDVSALVLSRLRAEELAWQLAEEEEQYRTTFTEAPVGIAHVDLLGKLLLVNERLARLLGYPAKDLQGRSLRKLAAPGDRATDEALRLVGEGRKARHRADARYLTRDGEPVWVTLTLSLLRDRQGRPKHMVATCEDISDLVTSKRHLEESNRHKDEFLAVLSHELRTPLAALSSAASLFEGVQLADPALEKARDILTRQTQQMTRLIDDLLDLRRIGSGQLNVVREGVDLAAIVERCFQDAELTASKRLHFARHLPDHPIWVEGDASRLAQVCANLLTNAIKYTPEGGEVLVRLTVEQNQARVEFHDNGVGIEEEFLDRLFLPFEQAPQDLARAQGGLGLGLALASQIARLHRGRLEARSPGRGQGSTFTLHLPLSKQQAPISDPAPPLEATPQALKFLIVEDSRDAAELLAMVLETEGHTATLAETAMDGLRMAAELVPDVILCDLGLPGMNGFELARQLRGEDGLRNLPLIALSGYGRQQDKHASKSAGFDAHLTKPTDARTVLQTARLVLSERRSPSA